MKTNMKLNKETRTFKVNRRNLPFLEKVLDRDGIPYEKQEKDGRTFVSVPISGNRFHEAMEDAFCEIEKQNNADDIPVYTYFTITHPGKLYRLTKINGRKDYRILKKDLPKMNENK